MKTFPVVFVEWIDSVSAGEWQTLSEATSDMGYTYSCGLLVGREKNYITLALSYDPDTDSVNCSKKIPLVAIKKMRTLCRRPIQKKTK